MKMVHMGKMMAAATVIAVIGSGCGKDSAQAVTNDIQGESAEILQEADSEAKTKSVDEVYQEITKNVSLYSPECMDEEFISNYYGIDAAMLEEYVFSMSEDAAQAETVIIMKAKDADDLEDLADCLQTVVNEKKNEMENYLPEQFAIVEKSEVQTKDNYVWLVISENADAIEDTIEKNLF